MSVDELRSAFARLVEPVVPLEDPYGRLLRRARRSWRMRIAGLTALLAAGVVATLAGSAVFTAAGRGGPPSPQRAQETAIPGVPITPWVQRLLDTPPRGSLAADGAFVAAVANRLRPVDLGFAPDLTQKTVLFAGDAGSYRAVLVAVHSAARQSAVWLVADAGTSADRLADVRFPPPEKAVVKALPEDLTPFTMTAVADAAKQRYLAVGLAPPGCRLATRDDLTGQTWRDAPTGDYAVRTDPLAVSKNTFERVTCDGVVRSQGPILNGRLEIVPIQPTSRQIDAAVAGARGTPPDLAMVRHGLQMLAESVASFDGCAVLYAGAVVGPELVVVACPTPHGDTAFSVVGDDGGVGGSTSNPTDPHAVIVTALPGDQTRLLVLAPPAAVAVQVANDPPVPLTDGVGSIPVPAGGPAPVRALDRSGAVLGTGISQEDHQAQTSAQPNYIDNWS